MFLKSLKKIKGLSVVETLVSVTFFTFTIVIFGQAVMSIQKSNAIVNTQTELRNGSDMAQLNIERVLKNSFYIFKRNNNPDAPNFSVNSLVETDSSFFAELKDMPSTSQYGNIIYFFTQDMVPFTKVVGEEISQGELISLFNATPSQKEIINNPASFNAIKNSLFRTLTLHILFLRKPEKTVPFNPGTLELVHAQSDYPIYHQASSVSGAESSIIWPENSFYEYKSNAISKVSLPSFLTGLDSTQVFSYYREIIHQVLNENGYTGWEKPEGNDPALIPVKKNQFRLRVLARNIGIKERISLSPDSDAFNSLPDDKGDYSDVREQLGLAFKYNEENDTTVSEIQGEVTTQKKSTTVDVVMYLTEYSPTLKSYVTKKKAFSVIPREYQKK